MKCKQCGYEQHGSATRCLRCGAKFAPQCTACGACPNHGLLCGKRESKRRRHFIRWDVSA